MNFLYPTRIKKSNLGDILINMLLIDALTKHGNVILDGDFEEYFSTPYNDSAKAKVKPLKGISFFKGKPILRWINVILSGVKLYAVFDPPGAYASPSNNIKGYLKFLKYRTRCIFLAPFGIKVFRVGVSMGPFNTFDGKNQKKLSRYYTSIAVRGLDNYKNLIEKDFSNIAHVEDLAFLFEKEKFIQRKTNIQIKGEYIIISLRGALHGKYISQPYLDKLILGLKANSSSLKSYKIVLAFQVEEDLHSLKLIKTALQEQGLETELIEKQLSMEDAMNLYSNAAFVITNRLHVALLAILNNSIPIIYTDTILHLKIVEIFKGLELKSLIKHIDTLKLLEINSSKENLLKEFKENRKIKSESILKFLRSEIDQ